MENKVENEYVGKEDVEHGDNNVENDEFGNGNSDEDYDEPQFKTNNSNKRKMPMLGIIALFIIVVAVLYMSFNALNVQELLETYNNEDKAGTTIQDENIKPSEVGDNLSDTNIAYRDLPQEPQPYSVHQPSSETESSTLPGDDFEESSVEDNLNESEIQSAIDEYSKRLEKIERLLVDLTSKEDSNGEILNIVQALKNKQIIMDRKVTALGRDGRDRDLAINNVLSKFKGVEDSVRMQRENFDLHILHLENWGGKERLVMFEGSQYNNIFKLSVGDSRGLWTLKSINNHVAEFLHQDGLSHKERIQ